MLFSQEALEGGKEGEGGDAPTRSVATFSKAQRAQMAKSPA
jgi:hypothetical protein